MLFVLFELDFDRFEFVDLAEFVYLLDLLESIELERLLEVDLKFWGFLYTELLLLDVV